MKDLKRMLEGIPDETIVLLGGSYNCDIVGVSVETSPFDYLTADLKLTKGWSVQNDKLFDSILKMSNEMYERKIKQLGRLVEIAKAPSMLDPCIEQMIRSFNEEVAKMPPPPPGYYYAPVNFHFKHEGDSYIAEGEIGLRPIIEPQRDDSNEDQDSQEGYKRVLD